jgi:small subunit ribosomal protein S9
MALKLSKKTNKVKKVIKKAVAAQPKSGAQQKHVVDPQVTLPTGKYAEGVGRRKVATARVRLYEAGGDFVVNGKVAGRYFETIPNASRMFNDPFEVTGTKAKFGVNATVSGSGISSQLDAVVHGISRALIEFNPDLRPLLKAGGFLTRDARMKETRKIGHGGKARAKRQSPKR